LMRKRIADSGVPRSRGRFALLIKC
jgi:hypothetical protein